MQFGVWQRKMESWRRIKGSGRLELRESNACSTISGMNEQPIQQNKLAIICSPAADTQAFNILTISAARPSHRLSLLLVHLVVLISHLILLWLDCSPAAYTKALNFLALSAALPSRRVNISPDTHSLLLVHLVVLISPRILLVLDCSPTADTQTFNILALSAALPSRRVNISPDTVSSRLQSYSGHTDLQYPSSLCCSSISSCLHLP
ncbi:hypothetical protein J6590_093871 [Homalodisca vitripennis]|nr:hypothetical protein J6590_093871 [Homalodisca vitripennis]